MKILSLLALTAVSSSLSAGDFKRFYAANPGEEITAIAALPGDGVLLTSAKKDRSGELHRVLLPERQLSILLPDGAVALAASSDYGVLFTAGGALYRKPVGPLGALTRLGDAGGVKVTEVAAKGFTLQGAPGASLTAPAPAWPAAAHPCDPGAAKTPLVFTPARIMLVTDGGRMSIVVEEIEGGKQIIDHGQCGGDFVWTLISTPRGALILPARRTVQIYAPDDGKKLAKTTVSKDAPQESVILPWRALGAGSPAGLIAITGGSLEWWSPQAKNLDQWGEVQVSLEPGK